MIQYPQRIAKHLMSWVLHHAPETSSWASIMCRCQFDALIVHRKGAMAHESAGLEINSDFLKAIMHQLLARDGHISEKPPVCLVEALSRNI